MTNFIGGEICKQPLADQLLPAEPRELTRAEIDGLWAIFVAIGTTWQNTVHDSAGLKSSWLEFVGEKTTIRPSYVAEYVNALGVVEELFEMYGEPLAFAKLFLDNGIATVGANDKPMLTLDSRLAHAKHFVVDEFIRVQVVAGGFKNFIQPETPEIRPDNIVNYNGFIAGSRYNRVTAVRSYEAPTQ